MLFNFFWKFCTFEMTCLLAFINMTLVDIDVPYCSMYYSLSPMPNSIVHIHLCIYNWFCISLGSATLISSQSKDCNSSIVEHSIHILHSLSYVHLSPTIHNQNEGWSKTVEIHEVFVCSPVDIVKVMFIYISENIIK